MPESNTSLQQELTLLLTLAPALNATNGFAHPDVAKAFQRVRELEQALPDTPERFAALCGLCLFYGNLPDYGASVEITDRLDAEANRRPEVERLIGSKLMRGTMWGRRISR